MHPRTARSAGGSRSLFDGDHPNVTIHGFWMAFPQHTTYLVVGWRPAPQSRAHPHDGHRACVLRPITLL